MNDNTMKRLRGIQVYTANHAAITAKHIDKWGEYAVSRAKELRAALEKDPRLTLEELVTLTHDEAIHLGFRRLSNDTKEPLLAFPAWMWWVLPEAGSFEGFGEMGEYWEVYDFAKGRPPCDDTRFGYLMFGIRFSADGSVKRNGCFVRTGN